MNSSIKRIKANQIELAVEVGKEELKKYVQETENQIGKELEADGFRKGKVPKDLLRNYIGNSQILEAALETSVRKSMGQAIEDNGLDVLNVSSLEVKENSAERLRYKALVTLFPEIKVGGLSFRIKRKEVSVRQEEVDKAIEGLRASRANLAEKIGPAEEGDRVEIDFETKINGAFVEGGVSKNHPLVLGRKGFIPGFEENLVGMSENEERVFSLTAPVDYYQKSIAGKKLDFRVKMNNVKRIEMPEFDDAFVKSLGRFKNTSQLVTSVKDDITEEKKLKEKQRVRLEILDKIMAGSEIIVPEDMVNQQLNAMIEDFDARLHENDFELGPYLVHIGKTQDDLRSDWRNEAERQVKIALILHKISRDKKITVTDGEVKATLNEVVQATMLRDPTGKGSNVEVEKLRTDITTKLINERTLEFLESQFSD